MVKLILRGLKEVSHSAHCNIFKSTLVVIDFIFHTRKNIVKICLFYLIGPKTWKGEFCWSWSLMFLQIGEPHIGGSFFGNFLFLGLVVIKWLDSCFVMYIGGDFFPHVFEASLIVFFFIYQYFSLLANQ